MPLKADSAFEELFGSHSRSIDDATSAAVSGPPLWNLTPLRSLKVHTDVSSLWVQLSARIGRKVRSGCVMHRNSPAWISMVRPGSSATVTGSMAPAGVAIATLIVAPGLPCAKAGVGSAPNPATLAMLPSTGSDRPSIAPWRMKARRSSRPASNSSMSSLSSAPRRRRSASKCLK